MEKKMSKKSLTVACILVAIGFSAWLGVANPPIASALGIGCFAGAVILIIISVIALNKERKE